MQQSTTLLGNKLSTLAVTIYLLYCGVLYRALLITPVLVTCLPFKELPVGTPNPNHGSMLCKERRTVMYALP